MKITDVETIPIGCPPSSTVMPEGEFLTSPLDIFPDRTMPEGQLAGLRGGSVYAVLVRVKTDEGFQGIGSVGVGNGAADYIIKEHLRGVVVGHNPFDVELL